MHRSDDEVVASKLNPAPGSKSARTREIQSWPGGTAARMAWPSSTVDPTAPPPGKTDDATNKLDTDCHVVLRNIAEDPSGLGQDDAVLRRWLVGAGRHEQTGAADPVRVELLDDHAVEQWAELATHYTV